MVFPLFFPVARRSSAAFPQAAPDAGCRVVPDAASASPAYILDYIPVSTPDSSMPLSRDEVQRIATLSRIALTDVELERAGAQLGEVLALFEQLRAIDTSGVDPMTHPRDQALRLRDDVADPTDRREAGQAMAPAVERGLYLVPKVIE